MCDPTALLDLVPSEGLLKRPSMDYNEYTYCYGGGRGGWYSSLAFCPASPGPRVVLLRGRKPVRAVARTCRIFYPARLPRRFLSDRGFDPPGMRATFMFRTIDRGLDEYIRRAADPLRIRFAATLTNVAQTRGHPVTPTFTIHLANIHSTRCNGLP